MTTDQPPSSSRPDEDVVAAIGWFAVSPPSADDWFAPVIDLPFTIGRDRSCDLVLDDERASRVHARVESGPDGLSVNDLASTNGVTHNGAVLVQRSPMQFDDTIVIGDHSLRFVAVVPDHTTAPGWTTD